MTRTFANAFHLHEVLPIGHYPSELCQILRSLSPRGGRDPVLVRVFDRSGSRTSTTATPDGRYRRDSAASGFEGRRGLSQGTR
jgi:hypothetical protein